MTAEETDDASSRPGTPSKSPSRHPHETPTASHSTKTSKARPRSPRSPNRPLSPIDLEPFILLGILPSLVAGWSAFPGFALLLTIYLNILYTNCAPFIASVESTPRSIADFALITARVLFLHACCRNFIAFSWDMFVDSVRQRPTLNPLLLRNFREATRILGCKLFPGRLLLVLHMTSALSLAGSMRLAHRFGIVDLGPVGGPQVCWRFLVNLVGKAFCFTHLSPCLGNNVQSKLSCLYTSCSAAALFLWMMAPNLSCLADDSCERFAYPWGETSQDGHRHILTFNFFFLVLANIASFSLFSYLLSASRIRTRRGGLSGTVACRRDLRSGRVLVVARLWRQPRSFEVYCHQRDP